MPEGTDHLIVRTFLYQLLGYLLGPEHTVGSDQFVYWLPTNPRRCLSPDVFVKLGVAQTRFGSWKCWERGAPGLAIEIISPNEGDGIEWDEKLSRYAELGVEELLRFDPEEMPGRRLRAWDRVEGDFVERTAEGDKTPCVALALHWAVVPVNGLPFGVRLIDDEGRLLATREEALDAARAAEAEGRVAAELRENVEASARRAAEAREKTQTAARRAAEARVEVEIAARGLAEARTRELEEELRRRR
jgi:Uma2 family endonuclease